MALKVSERKHRRGRRKGVAAAVAASALVGASFVVASASASPVGQPGANAAGPVAIGSAPKAPQGAVHTGAPTGDTVLHLGVNLAPRNPGEIKALAKAITTKGNPLYHHYLKKGQFGKLYGATPQTLAAVDASLRAEGLTPGPVSSDGLSISVTTTVGQAGKAFHTGFASYRLKDGTTGFLNTAAPQFSGSVAAEVTGVTGLDSTFRPVADHVVRSAVTRSATTRSTTAVKSYATGTGPQFCSSGATAMSPYGSDGQGWYSAQNLASVYGMDHTSTSGQGVTIGVLEWEQYSPSDLAAYQACYGTHVPVSLVKVDGGATVAPTNVNNVGIGQESLLDLEDLAALAPGASIIDYEGPSLAESDGSGNPSFTDANWVDPMRRMVTDDNAQVVSISYGGCELDSTGQSQTLPAPVIAMENWTFTEAALQGQTVLVSSGDTGAKSCTRDQGASYQNSNVVSDPASQPYVTAVGGTTLHGTTGSVTRTSWSNAYGASGGGTSQVWGVAYQSGFTGQGFSASACTPKAGDTCRQVPDVSALADPTTGYPIYAYGQWMPIGGTSGAAPTWAALVAQADTQSGCTANGPAGFINPALYSAANSNYAATFADVTTSGSSTSAFPAATGYDLSTGLGEPNGSAVAGAICNSLPVAATGPGTYHPVTPTRLLDTRYAIGVPTTTPVSATGIGSVQIEGNSLANIPPSGVTAVVLNVTVTSTTGNGHLTAWGDGTSRPQTSNLNWTSGQTISNTVTVPLSGDGWVDLYTNSTTHIIADVQGYYTNDTSGVPYTGLATPKRLLDTRYATGVTTTTPITNAAVTVPIWGVDNIPSTATGVVLNVTATGTSSAGYIAAYPSDASRPNVSNINWSSSTTQAGLVVVPLGSKGAVNLYVHGTSHVIADVFGYFDPSGALKFTKSGPKRLLDTRYAVGVGTTTAITGGHYVQLQVTGGSTGVPPTAQTVVLNVTVTGSTGAGHLTAWADGTQQPTTSNLNWGPGQTVPNLVVVPVTNGKVDLYVSSTTHVIADVFGYFS
jgi:subtilase family serine protease